MMTHNIPAIGGRDLLGLAITALVVPIPWQPAGAQNRGRRFRGWSSALTTPCSWQ
jgi:hypothetical protein